MMPAALQRALIFAAVLCDTAPVAARLEAMAAQGHFDEDRLAVVARNFPLVYENEVSLAAQLVAIRELRYDYLRADPFGRAAAILTGEGLDYLGLTTTRDEFKGRTGL